MESAFVPAKARGFSGEVMYVLHSERGERTWTVAIDGDRAVAQPHAASDPAVTIKAAVPVFVRLATGGLDPARAILEGKLVIEGDFNVAARLGEMFGQGPRF
jgi:putative sterol carrier protein